MKQISQLSKRMLLPFLFVMISAVNLFAQNGVGTPSYYNTSSTTGTQTAPLSSTTNKAQWIYSPSAFTSSGGGVGTPLPGGSLITKVYIRFGTTISATAAYTNFTISLGQNVGSISSYPVAGSGVAFNSGLTQSYFVGSNFQFSGLVASAWYGITLQTPFLYDPSKALIVEVKASAGTGNQVVSVITTGLNQRLTGTYAAATGTSATGLTPLGFDVIPGPNCIVPPTPGTATATPSSGMCVGDNIQLNLTGYSTGFGQTYQWQNSTNGGASWTDLGTALTSPNLNTPATVTSLYRCIVKCSGNSQPSANAPVNVTVPLAAGTYTINPFGGDFPSFTAAVAALSCGIAGPITFNVTTAFYSFNEQITIPSILFSSAVNTVKFDGNGNSISYASNNTAARHVIKLDGADNIIIEDLIIDALSGTYGWGIHLTNGADNNKILNCAIKSEYSSNTTNASGPIIINGSTSIILTAGINNNNQIIGCNILGGYYGITIHSGTTAGTESLNNLIENNTITDSYGQLIYLQGQKNVIVRNNNLSRSTRANSGTVAGVYLTSNSSNALIEKNRIHNLFDGFTSSTSTCYGIYVAGDGTVTDPNRVINNVIYNINHNGTTYGIYNSTDPFMKVYHNSISLDYAAATLGTTVGLYQTGVATGIEYKNNLISITRGGTGTKNGLHFSSTTSTITSNNNVVYVNSAGTGAQSFGSFGTTPYNTLVDWQTGANGGIYDGASSSFNPAWTNLSSGDLTPTVSSVGNSGTPVGVLTDILGNLRSLTVPDAGAYEFEIPSTDASISWAAPVNPNTPGFKTITVNIQNTQTITINSLVLGYTDGTTSQSQTFTGLNILPTASQSISFTTQYNLLSYEYMKAYITSVNGSPDDQVSNDTTRQILCFTLAAGTYTINPVGGDFPSISSAVEVISACGISGPVVFNVVAGTGPYNEQISIPFISGSSAVNTITFNGNGNTIAYAANLSGARHIIKLDGADFVTFNGFVVDGTVGNFGWGFHLTNQANNNSILNCTINVDTSITANTYAPIVINGSSVTLLTGAGNNGNNNTITGCTLSGGNYGVVFYGNSAAGSENLNNKLQNCIIKDAYAYSVYLLGQKNPVISSNDISRPTRITSTTGGGILLTTGNLNTLIEKNRIHNFFDAMPTNTSTCYGMNVTSDGTAAEPNRIINNLIYNMNGNGDLYGIYNSSGPYMLVYHNTISHDYTASTSTVETFGIFQTGTVAGIEYKNNIIYISRGGTGTKNGIHFATAGSANISNNNVIFMNSAAGTQSVGFHSPTAYATLSAWQSANGGIYDAASVSADPVFTDPLLGDYTPTNSTISNKGTPVGVLTDILGTTRLAVPDVGAFEFTVPGRDASITWVSPGSPATAGLKTITVNISNTQTLNITSLELGYTDGSTPQSQTFTGLNILPGANQNISFTTQYNLLSTTTLTAYVTFVNGTPDDNNSNDTTSQSFCIGLAGTYTINPVGGDFPTFSAAVAAMIPCGVAGPITFEVAPGSGPYVEQILIPALTGVSATNTVTFNGHGNMVSFTTVTADRHIFRLSGAQYITLNDLVIKSTSTTNFGWGIHLTQATNHITISNCTIDMSLVISTAQSNSAGIVASNSPTSVTSTGNNTSNLTIHNNTLIGANSGIVVNGIAANLSVNNIITNNIIRDFYADGISLFHNDGALVSNNNVSRANRPAVGVFQGIELAAGCRNVRVDGNRIHDTHNTASTQTGQASGIVAASCDAPAGSENIITNNLIYNMNSGTGIVHGMFNTSSDGFYYYHNTISLDHTAATVTSTTNRTAGLYQTTSASNIRFQNNIVTISRGGVGPKHCVNLNTPATSIISNNNNFYVTSTTGTNNGIGLYDGVNFPTLSNWQTANGGIYDGASTNSNPVYQNPAFAIFRPTSIPTNDTGTPLGVTNDITGAPRSATTPDVGAYEYYISPINIGATSLIAPVSSNCFGSAQTVTVQIKNFGTVTIDFALNPAIVQVEVTGATVATLTGNITGTLAPGLTKNVTMSVPLDMSATGTFTFNAATIMVTDGDPANDNITTVNLTKVLNPGTVVASPFFVCVSGAPTISIAGSQGIGNVQWQESSTGLAGSWNNVGTGGMTFVPTPVTTNMYYRAQVECFPLSATTNERLVEYRNPQIVSSSGATINGPGTANISASSLPTPGSNVVWYDAPSGGNQIGIGNNLITPLVINNTNFYATSRQGLGPTGSLAVPLGQGNTVDFFHHMFLVNSVSGITVSGLAIKLDQSAGTLTSWNVYYRPNNYQLTSGANTSATGWILLSTVTNVPSLGPGTYTTITANVALDIPGGSTYSFYIAPVGNSRHRYGSAAVGSVVASNVQASLMAGHAGTSLFNCTTAGRNPVATIFYIGCESPRVPVPVTVTPTTPIVASIGDNSFCIGNSTTVEVQSTNPNYTYTWTSVPAGFTATGPGPHTVAPTVTGNTTYKVLAYDAISQSSAYSAVTLNTTPNNLTIFANATPTTVCINTNSQLNSTAAATGVSYYSFTPSQGTFTPLVGGTIVGINLDDMQSPAISIGFPFNYSGNLYSTLYAGSNGYLTFNPASIPLTNVQWNTNNMANPLTQMIPLIAPLWDDIDPSGSGGVSSYLTSGPVGNRVFTFEWLHYEWDYEVNQDVISFQVKLYEADGKIEFIYSQGPGSPAGNGASIGLVGANVGNFLSLNGTGASPTASNLVPTNNLLSQPAEGQVYTFIPSASAISYLWTGPNLSAPTSTSPIAQNISASQTYSITATDANSGCQKSTTVLVDLFPIPSVSYTTDLSNFYCENQNINFNATASGSGPGTQSYSWTGPGFSSTIEDPTLFGAQVTSTGDYTVTFTDGYSCSISQTQYVEVNPNPVTNVTTTQNDCLNENGGTATFDITIQPTYNDYAILEGSNSGSSNPETFTGYTDGTYFYQVSELNTGCTSFGSFDITTVTNLPPVISCPANITVSNTPGSCGAYVNYTPPVGTDNCAVGLQTTLQAGFAPGGFFPIGTTVVRYRVTDDQMAYAECSFSVTVEDTEAPSYVGASSCPASFTACNPVSWTAPLFQDNCPGLQVTSNHSPGVNFPIGVNPVTYTATDLKGNVTTCTFNVTVLDSSLEATSITSDRDLNNICNGGDITLTVNGGHLGESAPGVPAQWKWYRGGCGTSGGGVLVGTGSSVTVTPNTTTTYYVRAEGGCRTTACVQLTVVVSVAPPNSAPVYTAIPAQGAPGVTSVLSVAPVPNATYYRWFTNNGHINSVLFNGNIGPWETNVPTVNVTFVLPESNYHIRVIAGNACGRTSQSNIAIRGTVPAPTSMTGPIQACPGSPVTYSIQAIPNGSPVTYNWSLVPASAGTITMSANGLSATVNFATGFGSAQVCANGISTFGLPGPAYCTTVTSSAPVPGAISGNTTPCSGNPIPELYSITAVPSAISYSWTCSVPGAIVVQAGNGLSASISFPATTFTGTIQVTASSICGTSAPSVLNITNGVPGNPGDITGASGGLCGAQDVAFSITTSNANSYLWTVTPGMSINGANNLNAVTIDFNPGFTSGTVSVEAFYACGSVIKTHAVTGTPSAPIIAPAALCANSNQTYFVTNLEPSTDYTWTTSGDITDQYCSVGSTSNCSGYYIETGPAGGSYTVTATNSCGTASTNSDPCRVMAESIDMKIYPNPTNGLVTVELYSKMGGMYKVNITDLSGRQVLSQDFKALSGRNQQEIDLGFANAGLYMVYIKDANGNIGVQKLSVE